MAAILSRGLGRWVEMSVTLRMNKQCTTETCVQRNLSAITIRDHGIIFSLGNSSHLEASGQAEMWLFLIIVTPITDFRVYIDKWHIFFSVKTDQYIKIMTVYCSRYSCEKVPNRLLHIRRTHGVIITSLWRRNDAATSFWHHDGAIIASCARWVILFLCSEQMTQHFNAMYSYTCGWKEQTEIPTSLTLFMKLAFYDSIKSGSVRPLKHPGRLFTKR